MKLKILRFPIGSPLSVGFQPTPGSIHLHFLIFTKAKILKP